MYSVGTTSHEITLIRGCPQWSKLGPRLWVATPVAFGRKRAYCSLHWRFCDTSSWKNMKLDKIYYGKKLETNPTMADSRGLSFSTQKSVLLIMKGSLTPAFAVIFGDSRIKSVENNKYLGLHMGTNRDYSHHLKRILTNSTDMFSQLKNVVKSKWGLSFPHASVIYKTIYIPRITYTSGVWFSPSRATTQKTDSAKRRALLAMTGAYKTMSTHALQVISRVPPLASI